MLFAKIPDILSKVTDLGCISMSIFNGTELSNNNFQKERFLTMDLSFMLFSLQFHEAPTMVSLKKFQTLYKGMLCEHSL